MGIDPHEYIDFLLKMREPGALDVLSISSKERGYPIIQTRHARLYGLHYGSEQEFLSRYERRRRLIDWDQLLIKIDLGKPKYRPENIERWNALRLPRSLALYPDEPRYRSMNIHHGVAVAGWEIDGSRQFNLSARHFDLFDWLNEGRVHAPLPDHVGKIVALRVEREAGDRLRFPQPPLHHFQRRRGDHRVDQGRDVVEPSALADGSIKERSVHSPCSLQASACTSGDLIASSKRLVNAIIG
jgi:Domain of unknown function (DUF1919)